MAISERRRLTFTIIAVILVGIITSFLLGGVLFSTRQPGAVTQNFDISIGHQDAYARPALVEKGAPAETKITTFYKWQPPVLVVSKGDTVILNVTNKSAARSHSFVLPAFGLDTGEIAPTGTPPKLTTVTLKFAADKVGVFQFNCGVTPDPKSTPQKCSPEHEYQAGWLIVLDK